jgi:hypothetical protein
MICTVAGIPRKLDFTLRFRRVPQNSLACHLKDEGFLPSVCSQIRLVTIMCREIQLSEEDQGRRMNCTVAGIPGKLDLTLRFDLY